MGEARPCFYSHRISPVSAQSSSSWNSCELQPHGPICARDLWSPFPIKFWSPLITLEIVFYQGKINKVVGKTKSASMTVRCLCCAHLLPGALSTWFVCFPSGLVCGADTHEIFPGKKPNRPKHLKSSVVILFIYLFFFFSSAIGVEAILLWNTK